MPNVNPFIDLDAPVFVANQAPAETGPYTPSQGTAVNPLTGSANTINAAGTSEPLATHVALVVAFALLGVWALRASGFSFVVAARVGMG